MEGVGNQHGILTRIANQSLRDVAISPISERVDGRHITTSCFG